MAPSAVTRPRYDWRACGISLVAGMAAAVSAGLAVPQLVGSPLFLSVVVTLVGTAVARWAYAKAARPDARPIDDEG